MPRDPIEWSNKFLLGIERIDAEHQIFADLINMFARKIDSGADRLSLARTLREIHKYAEFHFISEENMMLEWNYPELAAHAAIHKELLETLWKITINFSAEEIEPEELLDFLVDWFINHTAIEDQRISAYVKRS